MRKKAEFPMRYIYKENGGKHTALNVGVKLITSELTFIVDSDDTPVPDAIETTLQYHKKYKERKDLCGYSFLRRFPDGNINGKPFEPDEKVGTYIECRINADDTQADKAEVFYTRCLKEFPFPEYRNEKFLGEDLVWIRMAMKYQMVHKPSNLCRQLLGRWTDEEQKKKQYPLTTRMYGTSKGVFRRWQRCFV